MSQRLTAKPVMAEMNQRTQERVRLFTQTFRRKPKLSVILVGEDPASVIYTSKKGERAVAVGMDHETIRFPAHTDPSEVFKRVKELNNDPHVDGILIQRPLPSTFKEEEVLYWIAPEKDVDAFHPVNVGKLQLGLPCFQPCTPAGVMEILKHYKIPLEGKQACVIGRSSIVGKPMAALLLQANATVFHCHSRTQNLSEITQKADIIVVAAGKKRLLSGKDFKPGSVVIDVGMHRENNGKLCGDVDFESTVQIVEAITPVPGGVGPMTITLLLENTIWAAEQKEEGKKEQNEKNDKIFN